MANDENETTGTTVARNLARLRRDRGMRLADLAERIPEQHGLGVSALSKIENRSRKVSVDELTALAVALGVSPLALLLPDTRRPDDRVAVAGEVVSAREAWLWGIGSWPLGGDFHDPEDAEGPVSAFRGNSAPWWFQPDGEVPTDHISPSSRTREIERLAAFWRPKEGSDGEHS